MWIFIYCLINIHFEVSLVNGKEMTQKGELWKKTTGAPPYAISGRSQPGRRMLASQETGNEILSLGRPERFFPNASKWPGEVTVKWWLDCWIAKCDPTKTGHFNFYKILSHLMVIPQLDYFKTWYTNIIRNACIEYLTDKVYHADHLWSNPRAFAVRRYKWSNIYFWRVYSSVSGHIIKRQFYC